MNRRDSKPPVVEVKRSTRSTEMALAVAELSNLLQAMGLTRESLPLDAERMLTRHFTHYFELGQRSSERTIYQLKRDIEQRDEDARLLKLRIQDLQRQLRLMGRR
jgi:hypothetical protein